MKFKSNIEVQAGLKDSSGAAGTSGQILSSNGTTVSWINADGGVASDVQNLVKAGVAINKGQAVYVTSADGTNIVVGLASNTSEATSSKTLGLLDATVAINGMANVVQIGKLEGLNTSTATVGDPVWLGANGNLIYGLANKPYAPLHLVFIGIVTRVNANNGEIFINVQNGFELNEIHDVDLKTTIPVNGHILGYNGTLWVNKTIAGWLGYTPANDANVVHLTGNESITGNKSFSNSTANPAITVSNNNNGSFGIFLVNTLAGSGIYSVNSGSGGGISASNTSTGNGIYSGNGGTGTGIYSYNGSSGYGIFSLNSSTGTNVYLSNGASGKNLVLNNTTTNTGMPFTIQKIGVDKFTINDAGEAIGVKFIKSGGTSSQFLKADGSVDSSTYLTSLSGAVLTTGDQSITGSKSFTTNTAAPAMVVTNNSTDNGILLQNTSTGRGATSNNVSTGIGFYFSNASTGTGIYSVNSSTGKGIHSINSSTGQGIYSENSAGGWGIFSNNASTGRGINSVNASTGTGFYSTNSSGGTGIGSYNSSSGTGFYSNNSSTGNGIESYNSSSGYGIISSNTGSGRGIYSSNNSTGDAINIANSGSGRGIYLTNASAGNSLILNNDTAATGMPFTISKNGVNKFTINDAGEAYGSQFNLKGTVGYSSIQLSSGEATATYGISFHTTNIGGSGLAERMRVAANGNVGIGTTSPATKFAVSSSGTYGLEVDLSISNKVTLQGYNRSTSAYVQMDYDALLHKFSAGGSERMRITSGGEVLIGTTSDVGDYKLQVNGSILATDSIYSNGDVIAYASSDIRLKDNILPIKNALEKVKKIGGYTFDWNNKQTTYEGHDVGVIAQEIEAVLPEVVTTRDNGYKAVKYEKLTALLIESIKEQQVQIERLELLINKLTK